MGILRLVTATPSARLRPSLVVTEVKHEGRFEESKHPRDKHGRFISIGAHVDLGGGKVGEVLSAAHDAITVRRDDGKTETIKGDGLSGVAVTHTRTRMPIRDLTALQVERVLNEEYVATLADRIRRRGGVGDRAVQVEDTPHGSDPH